MTDKATLLELAERCEKATGPDRELIALIANAVDLQAADLICNRLPDYTASLDAAMTLVPEGWGFNLTRHIQTTAQARLTNDSGGGWRVEAATPALALTAAALRARASIRKPS